MSGQQGGGSGEAPEDVAAGPAGDHPARPRVPEAVRAAAAALAP